jgi:hypothetical protein
MADLRTEIIGIREEPTIDRRGNFVRVRVVEYMVGPHGPFRFQVPVEEYDPVRVRQLVEEEAQRIRALFGG